eukprot:6416328-Amphidinium_carterae.1
MYALQVDSAEDGMVEAVLNFVFNVASCKLLLACFASAPVGLCGWFDTIINICTLRTTCRNKLKWYLPATMRTIGQWRAAMMMACVKDALLVRWAKLLHTRYASEADQYYESMRNSHRQRQDKT